MVKKKKPSPKKTKKKAAKSGTAQGTTHARPAKKATKTAKAPKAKKVAKPKARKAARPAKADKARTKPAAKALPKKTVVKKTSKRGPALKSHQPAKKTSPAPAPAKSATARPAKGKADEIRRLTPDQRRKQLVAKARGTKPHAAFTLDDVRGELAKAAPARSTAKSRAAAAEESAAAKKAAAIEKAVAEATIEQRSFGAASLADILGYNPAANERPIGEEAQIDKKFTRFYKLLVELREHVNTGLQTRSEETLKRSSREDSGDLSGYGQHMADAGTDNFDRDFALSLVSNEQEALYEIEEAIKRIKNGTYGICENTGKPINKDRLLAVPFARFSVESQAEIEKTQRRSAQRGGVFGDVAGEEGAKFLEDDSE